MLKMQMQSWGCQRHLGSQGSPCPGASCSTVRGSLLAVEGLLCCAGTPWGPAKVPSAPGDSAGAVNAPRAPLTLLGASSAHHNENSVVIFCHFKLDFKSQVCFTKLIQFFFLRGTDLLPCRLRRSYKTCSGFPSETQ